MTKTKLTARDIDSPTQFCDWVAENVMGWHSKKMSVARGFVYCWLDSDRLVKQNCNLWDPLTDANADAEVREAVREHKSRFDIATVHEKLAANRCPWRNCSRSLLKYWELSGDWSLAVYSVNRGLDVLEVEAALKQT